MDWGDGSFLKCLPKKYEDLCLIPRTHVKLGIVTHTLVMPNAREAEKDGSLRLAGQPNLLSEIQVSESPGLKSQGT